MTGLGQVVGGRAVVAAGQTGQADQADQIEWVRQWFDLGALVWAVAAAAVVAWLALMAAMSRWLGPRRVRAGMGELDVPGDEPPALVNLLTSRWSVDRSAVPATLLDLAARKHVSIRLEGIQTVVHVPDDPAFPVQDAQDGDVVRDAPVEPAAPYETQVMDHVRALAERTDHRAVPVGALTTGTRAHSRGWWVRFRRAVEADAKQRGLARKRWSPRHKLALFVASLVPAAALGFALATAVYDVSDPDGSTDQSSQESDAYLVYAGLIYTGLALIGFSVASATRSGVTDTAEGRDQSARWLGWREVVTKDPLFKDHTAARVDLWGRKLSYGAAMGLADGAVRDLPLGAESRRRLWSSVGGSWRKVRVRRSPLNGFHPFAALLFGAIMAASAGSLARLFSDMPVDRDAPGLVALAIFGVMGVMGAAALVAGLLAIVLPRREVAGQVLRIRKRGIRSTRWHVVTDDGTSGHLRAWWMDGEPEFVVGAVIRTKISRGLRHAGDVHVEGDVGHRPDGADGPVASLMSGTGSSAQMHVRPITQQVLKLTARTGGVGQPTQGVLKLPGAAALSEVLGCTVGLSLDASLHNADNHSELATYELEDGLVYVAWTNSEVFGKMRRPRLLTREVEGVGEEAYRLRAGGALFARQGTVALMVAVHLSGQRWERDQTATTVARHLLDGL